MIYMKLCIIDGIGTFVSVQNIVSDWFWLSDTLYMLYLDWCTDMQMITYNKNALNDRLRVFFVFFIEMYLPFLFLPTKFKSCFNCSIKQKNITFIILLLWNFTTKRQKSYWHHATFSILIYMRKIKNPIEE